MRSIPVLILLFLLTSCASAGHTLKYGYLPGSDYQYYSPVSPVSLNGKEFKLVISDERKGNKIQCTNMSLPRDTELEGTTGFEFFSSYFKAMVEANGGVINQTAEDIITVKLTGLSGELAGAGYVRVYGLVEFNVKVGDLNKTYCSSMVDGDADAPVGKYAMDTRKGAFRKMVSGSTRRALEDFMHDLVQL